MRRLRAVAVARWRLPYGGAHSARLPARRVLGRTPTRRRVTFLCRFRYCCAWCADDSARRGLRSPARRGARRSRVTLGSGHRGRPRPRRRLVPPAGRSVGGRVATADGGRSRPLAASPPTSRRPRKVRAPRYGADELAGAALRHRGGTGPPGGILGACRDAPRSAPDRRLRSSPDRSRSRRWLADRPGWQSAPHRCPGRSPRGERRRRPDRGGDQLARRAALGPGHPARRHPPSAAGPGRRAAPGCLPTLPGHVPVWPGYLQGRLRPGGPGPLVGRGLPRSGNPARRGRLRGDRLQRSRGGQGKTPRSTVRPGDAALRLRPHPRSRGTPHALGLLPRAGREPCGHVRPDRAADRALCPPASQT